MFYNISSISILSNWFLKIFYIFSFSFALIKLNFVSLWFGAFYNIEPIYCFCKSIFKLFSKFSESLYHLLNQLFAAALICSAGAKRDIIYHPVLFFQAQFWNFIQFCFNPVILSHYLFVYIIYIFFFTGNSWPQIFPLMSRKKNFSKLNTR